MDAGLLNYAEVKQWREHQMVAVSSSHQELNTLHDQVFKKTAYLAVEKVKGEHGSPPAPFSFFLMGSAGRFEQSVWSDQDHGIIYRGGEDCKPYFLALGAEIRDALLSIGYELCDGEVMASNPVWCNSLQTWKRKISQWLEESSWQSLRHFSTFFDSRVLIGEPGFLQEIKETAFSVLHEQPRLYIRLIENVDFIQKGTGLFGQLLPELYGEKKGRIHLKQTTFFPYVNALRVLALKEKIASPSTLSRFRLLPDTYQSIKSFEADFIQLLDFRLRSRKNAKNYQQVHLVPIHSLNKTEKKELKQLMNRGYKLFSETKTIIKEVRSP
jgi:CBS domain-containing protein